MESPLPVRDGVNATRLRVPTEGPWPTIMAYVLERFGHVDPEGMVDRFRRGEVQGIGGVPITEDTPLGAHTFLWYYRQLPDETPIPVTERVLHRDEHLVVVDKPHFLPTTPGGMFVQESTLVRLRRKLDLPNLTPVHRLDRQTAGVLLFAASEEARAKYQLLFQRRQVAKTYLAVAPVRSDLQLPLTARSRLYKSRSYLLTQEVPGPPNAETRVSLLADWAHDAAAHQGASDPERIRAAQETGRRGLYLLEPHTGKTHQLRVHLAKLGIGIINDPFYPVLQEQAPDDYTKPLQLLAKSVEFTDPFTLRTVRWSTELELSEAPHGGGPPS